MIGGSRHFGMIRFSVKKVVRSFRFLILLTLVCVEFPQAAIDSAEDQEIEARAIENLIISPCCWRQPVSLHFSPASDEVRKEVREMLASGLGREEILEKYVAEYGERILAKPRARGFSMLAYFLPFAFLVLGAAVALVLIRRLHPVKSKREEKVRADGGRYSEQLEKELWG